MYYRSDCLCRYNVSIEVDEISRYSVLEMQPNGSLDDEMGSSSTDFNMFDIICRLNESIN